MTVDRASGRVVGSTRYMNIEHGNWEIWPGALAFHRREGYSSVLIYPLVFGARNLSVIVIVAVYLGVIVYLIVNHDGMADRNISQMQAQQQATDQYIRSVAGGAAGEYRGREASAGPESRLRDGRR